MSKHIQYVMRLQNEPSEENEELPIHLRTPDHLVRSCCGRRRWQRTTCRSQLPIAVWLQDPANASKYKHIGINVYVGLARGPTEKQLAELKKHDIRVICRQNSVGLQHKDDPTILAWMHNDEPDNAQSLGKGKGYGPPVLPANIVEDYVCISSARFSGAALDFS
jgi:hypothetical protein